MIIRISQIIVLVALMATCYVAGYIEGTWRKK
jgi:hypothetical protein